MKYRQINNNYYFHYYQHYYYTVAVVFCVCKVTRVTFEQKKRLKWCKLV